MIASAYVACAPRSPDPVGPEATPVPRRGGELRVVLESAAEVDTLIRRAVAGPPRWVARPAPAVVPAARGAAGSCSAVRPATPLFWPGGTPLRPDDVIEQWERALREGAGEHAWLLAPLAGVRDFVDGRAGHVRGLLARDDDVVVCAEQPAPDLERRLAHPALWPVRRGSTDRLEGPGPFRQRSDGTLAANPDHPGPSPRLESVRAFDAAGRSPDTWLRLGEADLAVVRGAAAARLAGVAGVGLTRLAARDRVYFLWIDPRRRWVNDPRFRRWLGASIDRVALLRHLFDGRGEPAYGLLERETAEPEPPGSRPLAASTTAHLELAFAADDEHAARIAARLRAELLSEGVDVALRPTGGATLAADVTATGASIALLAHEPIADDPVLDLLGTVWPLGSEADDARRVLEAAARAAEPRLRREGARLAEDGLLLDARVVPVVRVQAWLAAAVDLRGSDPGPGGAVALERIWWRR